MATRRCLHALRHLGATAAATHPVRRNFGAITSLRGCSLLRPILEQETPFPFRHVSPGSSSSSRSFYSGKTPEDDDLEDDNEEDVEEGGGVIDEVSDGEIAAGLRPQKREYTPEEKEAEASAIGYKVIGPLDRSDRVFKPYEPFFAVVQV